MDRPFPAYQGDQPYIFVCYSHADTEIVFPELYDEDGNRLEKYDQTAWKVYAESLPDYSHESVTNQIVDDAIRSWVEVNPDLKFVLVDDIQHSNIDIKWVKNNIFRPK